jgi:N-acylmannosamine kinase
LARVIVFDVGGTHTRAALFDGEHITWRAGVATPGQQGPDAVIAAMAELIAPLHDVVAPVGVAIACQVQGGCATAHNQSILRGWHVHPLAMSLAARIGRPVQLFNDARAAAWGEYRFGAGQGCSEFLFVTVSTGIGAGLVLSGRLHLARNGFDAELGDTLCGDGRTLEEHASGSALAEIARHDGHASGKALCDAADRGDAAAEARLRAGIHELARKLADLVVMVGVQRSAIGGGMGLRPGYLTRLREEMDRLPALYQHEMTTAKLGADAGLHGAAALVRAQ